jgi:hypothetical protein
MQSHTHRHGRYKVRSPFFQAKASRDGKGTHIGDEGLNDENQGDDGEIGEFLSCQLGPQLGED